MELILNIISDYLFRQILKALLIIMNLRHFPNNAMLLSREMRLFEAPITRDLLIFRL